MGLGKALPKPVEPKPEWVADRDNPHWFTSTDGLGRRKFAPPEPPEPVAATQPPPKTPKPPEAWEQLDFFDDPKEFDDYPDADDGVYLRLARDELWRIGRTTAEYPARYDAPREEAWPSLIFDYANGAP
jgi:hypothetical protein